MDWEKLVAAKSSESQSDLAKYYNNPYNPNNLSQDYNNPLLTKPNAAITLLTKPSAAITLITVAKYYNNIY